MAGKKTEGRSYAAELGGRVGDAVRVEGWVHDTRLLGKISFVVLRDATGKCQVTAVRGKASDATMKAIEGLRQEDVIEVTGKVAKSNEARAGFEILPDAIEILNKSATPLPLDPRAVTKANMDTQLDWRVLYMRTDEARAIFRIQSRALQSFRDFLLGRSYLEIQPPVIIASASEGGSELFEIPYFEKHAYLAQSPQLYKQMCALAFEKVFTVLPIFRAEKFDQPTHLNEVRQMDIEQAFATDDDVIKVLEECVVGILKDVKKDCAEELKTLGREDFKVPKLPLRRVTYDDVVKLLQKAGEKVKWGDDFSKTQEKMMAKLVGEELFVLKDWPTQARAFYSMPHEDDPKKCKAFDLVYNGLEICSGAQRIHLPDLLEKQLRAKGLDPASFKSYIDVFRYGAPFHSGWSIGLERLTMQITGRPNIREATMFPRTRDRITP
jgi:aspartyl-tRNA synthetase